MSPVLDNDPTPNRNTPIEVIEAMNSSRVRRTSNSLNEDVCVPTGGGSSSPVGLEENSEPTDTIATDTDDFEQSSGVTQYRTNNGISFYPSGKIHTPTFLPSGVYRACFDGNSGQYYALRRKVKTDNLLQLPYKVFHDVVRDIRVFWTKKEEFRRYGLVNKRGILLYGPPGGGKSSLILLVQKLLIQEQNGVVFLITSLGDLACFIGFMENGFQYIEPDRQVLVILEDIDGLMRDLDAEAQLLQVLDGAKQMNNIVYLATTNHLDKLQERITNRPSRFDRVYEIGFPDAKIRRYYLDYLIQDQDKSKVDIDRWVDETQDFTFAHLRDLVVSVIILENEFDDVIKHLRGLKNKPKDAAKSGAGKVGFGASGGSGNNSMEFYDPADEVDNKS